MFAKPPKEFRLEKFDSLATALSIDLVAGFVTSMFVAPIVAIIDKSIIANASGKEPLKQGLTREFHALVTTPIKALRQPIFFPVFAIFWATYTVANTTESICIFNSTPVGVPKFAASSSVNIVLCSWKDSLFTKWFGTVKPKPVPPLSFLLFGLRDSLTVGTSFLGPSVGSRFHQNELQVSKRAADFTTQMIMPCLVQFVSTPIHLVSLDLYNHPHASVVDRWRSVKTNYWGSAWGRVFRTLPGFGVGGVVNRNIRVKMNKWIENA
ncbi:hypothetical protein HDU98_009014 [Podochytrium sp. JEL0797]|nr:hypothetical protein HDU98_009014 [Podochytrium sp. JEL0797]